MTQLTSSHAYTLLVEIGVEEIPARFVEELRKSFALIMYESLQKQGFVHKNTSYKDYASTRRLAFICEGIIKEQHDEILEKKGPAWSAAFDEKGNLTKACNGFLKSANANENDIFEISNPQGKWVGIRQKIKGAKLAENLPKILSDVLKKIPLKSKMHWGNGSFEFIRPIRSISALIDEDVITGSLTGDLVDIKFSNTLLGHRVHCPQICITDARKYVETLKEAFVIVNTDERKNIILDQCKKLENELKICIKTDLVIDEVVGLTEYPSVAIGTFDKEFLQVPREVLIATMANHQKYFHVESSNGELLNYFVCISNIDSNAVSSIIKGNERVIRPRFSDAKFFYEQDIKIGLDEFSKILPRVIFMKGLGSLADKQTRIKKLSLRINKSLEVFGMPNIDDTEIDRASDVCKADLMSSLVGEFPEMQGIAGEYYAKSQGMNSKIARAIREQYLPINAKDAQNAESTLGQIFAIADRIDSITAIFSIGKIPTGDNDPFAMRRSAFAIFKTLNALQAPLHISDLVDWAIEILNEQNAINDDNAIQEIKSKIMSFFIDRLRFFINDHNGLLDALLCGKIDFEILSIQANFKLIEKYLPQEGFTKICESNRRMLNFLKKSNLDKDEIDSLNVKSSVFKHNAEHQLWDSICNAKMGIDKLNSEEYEKVLQILLSLSKPLDIFFTEVLINDKDDSVRKNRIALIISLQNIFVKFTHFHCIQPD